MRKGLNTSSMASAKQKKEAQLPSIYCLQPHTAGNIMQYLWDVLHAVSAWILGRHIRDGGHHSVSGLSVLDCACPALRHHGCLLVRGTHLGLYLWVRPSFNKKKSLLQAAWYFWLVSLLFLSLAIRSHT